jgi:hypothetical protein
VKAYSKNSSAVFSYAFSPLQTLSYNIWRQIYALKKVGPANISFGTPRYNWAANTAYAQYKDNDSSLFTKEYFVLTTDLNVYKCLQNAGGANSTVMPTGTSTSSFQTSDGYIWKYMYSVTAAQAITFLTPSFVSVQTIPSNDGSTQWAVQAAAIPGFLEVVDVIAGGTGFTGDSGTVQAASSSTVTLTTSAATGQLVGSVVYIASGTGAGQLRTITAWNGSTKVATVSPNWSTTPDGTSTYLSTNFDTAPYYDCTDETDNYERTLFKSTVAVQARERSSGSLLSWSPDRTIYSHRSR